MSTAVMMERIAEGSPLFKARTAGLCWLMTTLTSTFALFVGGRLIVSGDAAATATNILEHEALFRSGTAAILISTACYVAVTLLVYELLKPVNRTVSLLAAFFSLVGCAVGALSCVFDLAPFVLLRGDHYLSVFTVEQLQALATHVSQSAWSGQRYRPGIFRASLPLGWLVTSSSIPPSCREFSVR